MATSRFSQIFSPSAYTDPFDLGIYAQLIQQRQNSYDKNIALVENQLAQYSNIPLPKASLKEYANSRLKDIMDQTNEKYRNADYSDPSIFRGAKNMISGFTSDPIIMGGLTSSVNIQSDMAAIEKAKKDKTYALQNAQAVNDRIAKYMNDPSLESTYTAGGYMPYVDHDGPIIDKLKQLKDIGSIQVNDVDPNDPTKTVLRTITRDEITPERISSVVNSLWTPDQRQQLAIDAQYINRGVTTNPSDVNSRDWITSRAAAYYQTDLQRYKQAITEVQNNKQATLNLNPSADVSKFDNAINTYTEKVNVLNTLLSNPEELYKIGALNLNELKTWDYTQGRIKGYVDLFQHTSLKATTNNQSSDGDGNSSSTSSKAKGGDANLTSTGAFNPNQVVITYAPTIGEETTSGFATVMNDITTNQNIISNSAKSAYESAYRQDPTRFPMEKANETIAEWNKQWAAGNYNALPPQAIKYFEETSNARTNLEMATQFKNKADAEILSDPNYIKMFNGYQGAKKLLKPSYDLKLGMIIAGKELKGKSTSYSADAITTAVEALEKNGISTSELFTGLVADIFSGITRPINEIANHYNYVWWDKLLERQPNGDNRLIDDLNKQITEFQKMMKEKDIEHPIASSINKSFFRNGIVNPILTLGQENPEVLKTILAHNTYKKELDRMTEAVYHDKLGFTSMMGSVVISGAKDQQDFYVPEAQSLSNAYNKGQVIKSVTSFTSMPNGEIVIEGLGANDEAVKFRVPYNVSTDLTKKLPKDDARSIQQYLKVLTGTTTEMGKAPVITFKHTLPNGSTTTGVVPYRYYVDGDAVVLQFFNKQGGLISDPNNTNRFSSLSDLQRNIPQLAKAFWLRQNTIPAQQNQNIIR